MKKIALTIGLVAGLSAGAAFGQGQMTFSSAGNFGGVVNAPITNTSSVKASGTAYSADLFYGVGAGLSFNQLTDAGFQQAFLTGGQAGYFAMGPIQFGGTGATAGLATIAAGQTITVAVVAWNNEGGTVTSYGAALAHPGDEVFLSNLVNVTLTTPPTTPAGMLGLAGGTMTLVPVPEPTTLALGGLGAATLLLLRRRK